MPKFLIDHLEGCTPASPCASCATMEFLRTKLQPEDYDAFLRMVERGTGAKLRNANLADIDFRMPWSKLLKVSGRTENCIKDDNIISLADLVQKTPVEILRIHNMGRKSRKELEDEPARHGLKLNMYIPVEKLQAPAEKTE